MAMRTVAGGMVAQPMVEYNAEGQCGEPDEEGSEVAGVGEGIGT
jgi:hypothetical protein